MSYKIRKKTKAVTFTIGFAVLAAAIAAIVLANNSPAGAAEPVKFLPYYDCSTCEHDESTYKEPTIQEGKYYLDADIDQCYLELKDGYINLVGTDEQIEELTKKTADQPYPLTADGIRSSWTEAHKYYIYTMHPYGDMVMLSWEGNVIFDETGKIERGAGVGFNSETATISGYALGNFTLIG